MSYVVENPVLRGARFVDADRNVWYYDEAHAGYPAHWDVQVDGGAPYYRVGLDGGEVMRGE
jgi:hypothetical protein